MERIPFSSPILFAHRGGRGQHKDNSLAGFKAALAQGVTGLETDVWLTRDGVIVLDHDGIVGKRWWFHRSISKKNLEDLPRHVPTLEEFLDVIDRDVHISIDLKSTNAAELLIQQVRAHNPDQCKRLWLADSGYGSSNWQRVATWRELDPDIQLVDSTSLERLDLPFTDYVKRSLAHGIGTLNLDVREWTPHLREHAATLGIRAFAFGAVNATLARHAFNMKMDAIYCDQLSDIRTLEHKV